MSILFFWLERGGGWGSSPSTSPPIHQELNVIHKQAFSFLVGEGWWMAFGSIDQPDQSSEVERNPKMSISFFLAGEGWQMQFESIDQPTHSSEVERNPKVSILFFRLERGGRWGSSPLTSPADHHKLNVKQK